MYDKFHQLTDDGPTSIRRVTAAFLMTSEDKDLISEDKPLTATPDLPVSPEPETPALPPAPVPQPMPLFHRGPAPLMQASLRAGEERYWQEGEEVCNIRACILKLFGSVCARWLFCSTTNFVNAVTTSTLLLKD